MDTALGLWAVFEDPNDTQLRYFAKNMLTNEESVWVSKVPLLLTSPTQVRVTRSINAYTGIHIPLLDTFIYNGTFISREEAINLHPELFI